jgi:hypothetical protein
MPDTITFETQQGPVSAEYSDMQAAVQPFIVPPEEPPPPPEEPAVVKKARRKTPVKIIKPKRTAAKIQSHIKEKMATATVTKREVGRPRLSDEEKAARRAARGLPPKVSGRRPGRPRMYEYVDEEGNVVPYGDEGLYDREGKTRERLTQYLANPEHTAKHKVGRVVNYTYDEGKKGVETTARMVRNLTTLGSLPEYTPPDFSVQRMNYQPLIYDPQRDPYYVKSKFEQLKYVSPYTPVEYIPESPTKYDIYTPSTYAPREYKPMEWETVINKPGNEYLMGQSENLEEYNPLKWLGDGESNSEDKNMVLDYEPHQYEEKPYENLEYKGITDRLFGNVQETQYNKNLLGSSGYINDLNKPESKSEVLVQTFGDFSKLAPLKTKVPEPVVQPKVQLGNNVQLREKPVVRVIKPEKETGVSLF